MLNPLNHYSLENPGSIYDEEAMTALELAGRTAQKVNEVIQDQNLLHQETDDFRERVAKSMKDQDDRLDTFQDEVIPEVADATVLHYINNGTFDQAISEYAHELESRLDNLLTNLPEGSTTMDAEVVDIRVDDNGVTHDTAGNAMRSRLRSIVEQAKNLVYNSGVYPVPVTWATKVSDGKYYFETIPFKVPQDGFSLRVSENFADEIVDGAYLIARAVFGTMVDGKFTENDALNETHHGNAYSDRFTYVPYIQGAYVKIRLNLIKNSAGQLTASNYQSIEPLVPLLCKAYTGKVKNGGNLLGFVPATVVSEDTAEKYKPDWTMRGFLHKWSCVTSPLPLEFVERVSCGPRTWLGAKVYKFDPVTRTTKFVQTLHHNMKPPCYGAECAVDFTGYGKNYFAILVAGRVPEWADYASRQYQNNDKGVNGVEKLGLDLSSVVNDIHVDWVSESTIRRTLPPGSPVVQKNVELMRGLKHKTVPARYARGKTTASFYLLGQDDFAGVYYGGNYARGTFYYNVSPATYFTALLNPNSVAYGDADPDLDGAHYGIVCSAFTSLLHGYPFPLSTFDMRYNKTLPMFEIHPFNLLTDAHKLKQYDLLTQGAGETGHTVMVSDITNVGDMATAVNIFESGTPSTRENVFFVHNGLDFYRNDPEESFPNAYNFMAVTDPAQDVAVYDKANWVPAYTEPRPVMCSRGYGSVYVKGVNSVRISCREDVATLPIHQDGKLVGVYRVDAMNPVSMNGYNVVDITGVVKPGKVSIIYTAPDDSDVDYWTEEFYVVDPADYVVYADVDASGRPVIHADHQGRIKWVNVLYTIKSGEYQGKGANVNYAPGTIFPSGIIPNVIDMGDGVTAELMGTDYEWQDRVNVVYMTDYDTNTFGIDGQGDAFN